MANGCQIRKQDETYFITLTVVNWIDVFTRRMYRDIVVENLVLEFNIRNAIFKVSR